MDTERYRTDSGLGTIDLVACFYTVYQTRPFATNDFYLLCVGNGLSDEKFKGCSFILELQCMLHLNFYHIADWADFTLYFLLHLITND